MARKPTHRDRARAWLDVLEMLEQDDTLSTEDAIDRWAKEHDVDAADLQLHVWLQTSVP